MQKEIIISGERINYQIKRYKLSKHLRLSIRPCFENESPCQNNSNLKILVTAPKRISERMIETFLKEEGEWIVEKLDELKNQNPHPRVMLDKRSYRIEKEKARKIISNRVNYFGNLYGFNFKKISIRAQRTRWGSCAKNGNLSFNYKIIYLPEEIMDYVIVHELCHLDQFNHSKRFWFLVSEIVPDYRNLRRQLKKISI